MLRKHKILALPVYRMEPTNNRVRYTGIVSVFGMCISIGFHCSLADLLHTIAFQPVFSVIDSFAEQRQLEQSEEALCQPVKKSLYTAESSVSPWIFALETPLSQVPIQLIQFNFFEKKLQMLLCSSRFSGSVHFNAMPCIAVW
jgi:hypothetical protein